MKRSAAVIVVLASLATLAHADECFDRAAVCHFKAGQALLTAKPPDPKRAAERLLASYQLEPRTDTLALYAVALGMDRQHALATEIWERVHKLAEQELAEATGRSAVDRAQNRVDNAANAIAELAPHIARVRIRFVDQPRGLVVSRERQGDVDPARDVIVNAERDVLVFKFADGRVERVVVEIGAGQVETITAPTGIREPAPAKPPVPVESTGGPRRGRPASTWVGIGLVGGGVLASGVAGTFALLSRRDWNEALTIGCNAATRECDVGPAANLASRSNDRARVAQIAAIGAGALVVTGVAIWLVGRVTRAPSVAVQIEPTRGGGVATIGWFTR